MQAGIIVITVVKLLANDWYCIIPIQCYWRPVRDIGLIVLFYYYTKDYSDKCVFINILINDLIVASQPMIAKTNTANTMCSSNPQTIL